MPSLKERMATNRKFAGYAHSGRAIMDKWIRSRLASFMQATTGKRQQSNCRLMRSTETAIG